MYAPQFLSTGVRAACSRVAAGTGLAGRRSGAWCAGFALALAITLAGPGRGLAETAVDLELVLAVDASASVDDGEFRLQLDGTAAAFESAEVVAAIRSGPAAAIAVSLLVWAEATMPPDQSDWHVLRTVEDAARFAALLRAQPRSRTGGTGLGSGLAHAMRSFDGNGIAARRQVVDVSGDGRETPPRDFVATAPHARSQALSRGVTINGLAIVNEDGGLADWYRANVATGYGSFVMVAKDYLAFAAAMRRKLLREIENHPPVSGSDDGTDRRRVLSGPALPREKMADVTPPPRPGG
jgi:Protein of unknown function (DUF1194)